MKSLVRLWCVLCVVGGGVISVGGAELDPKAKEEIEWITRSFMKEKSFPDRARYYTGELRLAVGRPTPGESFADPKFELEIRINDWDENSAAVATTVFDPKTNQRSDFYLFFRHEEDRWKLSAIRTFLPPRGMGQMYGVLHAKGKNINQRDLRELATLQVLQFNDWGLKQMFEQRREKLEEIAAELVRRGFGEVIHGNQRNARAGTELSEKVKEAGVNYVQLLESGIIDFNAAAFGQSGVGFIWVHPSGRPPLASPENYILVEPLDGSWYLYRRQ
jgi:hypothetical protein